MIASEFVKCWGLAPDSMTQSGAVGTRRVQDLLAYWTSHNGTSSSIRVQYHLRHLNQSCNSDQLHVEIKVNLMSLSEEERGKKSRKSPTLWPKSATWTRFTLGPREDLFSLHCLIEVIYQFCAWLTFSKSIFYFCRMSPPPLVLHLSPKILFLGPQEGTRVV